MPLPSGVTVVVTQPEAMPEAPEGYQTTWPVELPPHRREADMQSNMARAAACSKRNEAGARHNNCCFEFSADKLLYTQDNSNWNRVKAVMFSNNQTHYEMCRNAIFTMYAKLQDEFDLLNSSYEHCGACDTSIIDGDALADPAKMPKYMQALQSATASDNCCAMSETKHGQFETAETTAAGVLINYG